MNSYDLENRCFEFAKAVALYCYKLPRNAINVEYIRQVVRASSSVGANYIETNEGLSRKDKLMHAKISRKEAKESGFFLRLIRETNQPQYSDEGKELIKEADELRRIFSSIVSKIELGGKSKD